MFGDFDIFGVFVPRILVMALLAYLLNLLLRRILSWVGLYRLVWHPALFDLALFVLLLGAIANASKWYLP
jgi:hypothetical protein